MNDTKPLWTSQTFWGVATALAGMLLARLGYTFTPEDQAAIVQTLALLMEGGGSIWALIGRVRATKRIG